MFLIFKDPKYLDAIRQNELIKLSPNYDESPVDEQNRVDLTPKKKVRIANNKKTIKKSKNQKKPTSDEDDDVVKKFIDYFRMRKNGRFPYAFPKYNYKDA